MKFNDVISGICKTLDLKRIASAHVVDYQNLSDDELRRALLKVKPQYLHNETISNALDKAFFFEALFVIEIDPLDDPVVGYLDLYILVPQYSGAGGRLELQPRI